MWIPALSAIGAGWEGNESRFLRRVLINMVPLRIDYGGDSRDYSWFSIECTLGPELGGDVSRDLR